jgi:hypothetical protein
MIRELDASTDWLTLTTRTYRDTELLRKLAAVYIGQGRTTHPWRFLGYLGRRIHYPDGRGGLAFAERDQGTLGVLQVWGAMTDVVGRRMADHRLRASRVDLAVTVLHDEPQAPVCELIPDLRKTGENVSCIVPISEEGGTLYVGDRGSDQFGRLYDKGSQLGDEIPARLLWRYEVEYKRACAQDAAERMFYTHQTSDVRRQMIVHNVGGFFRHHQIPVEIPEYSDSVCGLIRYATRVQDDARTIKWLSEQVRPAIFRLVLNGQAQRVWDALGVCTQDGLPSMEQESEPEVAMPTLWDWLDKYAMT